MSASNLVPPEALKVIKPYLTLASQLEQRQEKSIAYYCRLYAVQNGMATNVHKTSPECKKFLFQLMDILEATKLQNKNDEAIQSQIVGQAFVEKYALKLFEKADDDDRQSRFNKNLVKQFYTAGLLFDILNYFGDLSEDLIAKKQYAKRKAMYLNRCFQTGETPVPGPLTGDDFDNEFGASSDGAGAHGYDAPSGEHGPSSSSSYQPPSSGSKQIGEEHNAQWPSSSSPSHHSNQIVSDVNYYHDEKPSSSSKIELTPDQMQRAQKFCKHATSALQYDDISTAISNLEQCLKLLKTGK